MYENNFHVKERLRCLFPLKYIRCRALAFTSSNSKMMCSVLGKLTRKKGGFEKNESKLTQLP